MPISIVEAKRIDLVDYLSSMGYTPNKIRNQDYWYLSPLREEKTPSFKVNRTKNIWYDHGIGEGGNIIDFGTRYFNCTVSELLQKLPRNLSFTFSFHPPPILISGEKKSQAPDSGKIKVIQAGEITDQRLMKYLADRQIPMNIASQFCQEVKFEIYGKKQVAIGFENNDGGYELRNSIFKGSSTPKQPKLIPQTGSDQVAVFEGFFSFLSFKSLHESNQKEWLDLAKDPPEILVLNSLSFFEKSRELWQE